MIALMLFFIAPSICKDDISASAICHLKRFSLVNWCISRPTQFSSCCFGRGWLAVYFFIYVFICWSSRMTALLLCYHSIAPCISKGGISASAVSFLEVCFWFLYRGRPKQASSCCFGGLSCGSSFCFAASRVQSMNWKQLSVPSSLLFVVLLIYFRIRNLTFWLRKETNYFFFYFNNNNNNNQYDSFIKALNERNFLINTFEIRRVQSIMNIYLGMKVGVYLSNYGVLFTLGYSMSRKLQKVQARPAIRPSFCNVSENTYAFIINYRINI